jgi:hypothetical protein
MFRRARGTTFTGSWFVDEPQERYERDLASFHEAQEADQRRHPDDRRTLPNGTLVMLERSNAHGSAMTRFLRGPV